MWYECMNVNPPPPRSFRRYMCCTGDEKTLTSVWLVSVLVILQTFDSLGQGATYSPLGSYMG